MKSPYQYLVALALSVITCTAASEADEWSVPLAGNTFRTAPGPGGDGIGRGNELAWSKTDEVYSVYFRVDRATDLKLAVNAKVRRGVSQIEASYKDQRLTAKIDSDQQTRHTFGSIIVAAPGYVRVDIRGLSRVGSVFAEISDLIVTSETNDLSIDYVRTNNGNMFYWGRRGPSVHLRYKVPSDRDLRYAYSEITVPDGQDPIGTYYMANGFGQGYFGMQVNSAKQRRVLFSVWSPFKTDNPRDIPVDQRIVTLGQGPDVHIGKFGNEGSGGQSYLVYPWTAGRTYRFLTEVKPLSDDHTAYTCWFGDKSTDEWRLIASFSRPQTTTHLTGFHSFLESFSPSYGYIERRGVYGNVWVRDTQDQWHECTQARFSVDATGGGRHRLDYTGGVEGRSFFMQNCGFFAETGIPGKTFTRDSTADQQPKINFDALPRG